MTPHLRCLLAVFAMAGALATAPAVEPVPPKIDKVSRTEGGKFCIGVKTHPVNYHVLRRSRNLDFIPGRPVAIRWDRDYYTTLVDSVPPKQQAYFDLETHNIFTPADTDGDGFDDLTELLNPGTHNPLNPAPPIALEHGATQLPSRALYEQLSDRDDRPGAQSVREVKFLLYDVNTDTPDLYFVDTTRYPFHYYFTQDAVMRYTSHSQFNNDTYFLNGTRKNVAGSLISHENYVGPNAQRGLYTVEFWPTDPVAFRFVEKAYEMIAAGMPFVDGNIAYHPASETHRRMLRSEQVEYDESHINIIHTDDLFGNVVYTGLNEAEAYGRLKLVTGAETLSARDIVIFRTIPNDLTHVAGIMTEIPQTPLSHINLKAKQNNTPNAYIKDAASHPDIAPLLGENVYFKVGPDGFEIRAASQAEVTAWFEDIRPTEPQFPERDLSVTTIQPLSAIAFEDSSAFGSKAANLAELRTILPTYTPDGFAVPFYFYDEFMKHNGFYTEALAMMAEPLFQSYPQVRETRLAAFRERIKDGALPPWMADALDAMHRSFPPGTTPRARSSTNNEDLAGFNGAGLYSSFTHRLDEGHFQKTARQVWSSLWNYRAFEEREFWRIDHLAAAMGILVHPNFDDEQANGVGVTKNIFDPRWHGHYINVQVGENLVTNPDAESIPEEFLIARLATSSYEIQYIRFSNQVPEGETILTRTQALELKDQMTTLHNHFRNKYPGARSNINWAMEIEFKITEAGQLIIKQARPWLD